MKNRCFGIFLSAISGILFLNSHNYFFIVVPVLLVIYGFYKKSKISFIYIITFLLFCFYRPLQTKSDLNGNAFYVQEVHENYALIKQNNTLYLYYQNEVLNSGNTITLNKPTLKRIRGNGVPNLFDFSLYLMNSRVLFEVSGKVLSNDNKVIPKDKIINLLTDKLIYSKEYVQLILFNKKSSNTLLYVEYNRKLGISNLLTYSGVYFYLFLMFFLSIFQKINKNYGKYVGYGIGIFYLYLLNFPIGSVRILLTQAFASTLIKYRISKFDFLSVLGIIYLLIDPYYLFKDAFIFGFVLGFFSYFGRIVFKNKSKVFYIFYIAICLYPLLIEDGYSLFQPILNLLSLGLVAPLYILSFITLIVPILDNFTFTIFVGLQGTLKTIQDFNIIIVYPHNNLYFYIGYYVLFYLYLVSKYLFIKKGQRMTIFCLIILNLNAIIRPIDQGYVMFIDVGQGDSTLIHGKNNQYNILIDTGGLINIDISERYLIPYFRSVNIKQLDYVIITHDDYDHNGALPSLNSNFKISNIIKDVQNFELKYKDLYLKNINKYYSYSDEDNYKSLVFYMEFLNYKFMLMGDAPVEIEKLIVKDYNYDCDILKVGHHGSKTSTSQEFLEKFKFEKAIISCGVNNKYKHPNTEVLDLLDENQINYYRTDLNGSVFVYSEKIKTTL
jgi:competence protein ComEC